MIVRDRNHPSIIIWGARLNETPNNVPFYTRTNELAHALDDSRPTGGAMAGQRLTTDYEQDVFGEDDYSSVSRSGSRRATSSRPCSRRWTGQASRTWSARRSARCPGRPSYYRRTDPPGRPAGTGDGTRAGARHRRLRRPLLRPARVVRVRLPVRQRQPASGREVHRRGRPVPDPQARRRHLPGAGRPAPSARSSRPRSTGTSARSRRLPACRPR